MQTRPFAGRPVGLADRRLVRRAISFLAAELIEDLGEEVGGKRGLADFGANPIQERSLEAVLAGTHLADGQVLLHQTSFGRLQLAVEVVGELAKGLLAGEPVGNSQG